MEQNVQCTKGVSRNNRNKLCRLCGKPSFGTICRECFCKKGRTEARKRQARKHNKSSTSYTSLQKKNANTLNL